MRLIRGLSVQLVGIPANVTFASHMFRLNVARARFCFNFCRAREISVPAARMDQARLGFRIGARSRNWSAVCPFSPSSVAEGKLSWRRVLPGRAI
jgi:hypothetical protein